MRFHALLPVRDEADIIYQCLQHMLTWADAIYVFDTGSVDNTWDIIQDFAAKEKRVVPLRKDSVYFSENLVRGWLFHQVRQNMRTGDWFLRVDADEFHHMPPPEFVKARLRPHETIVYHQYYNFVLRDSEVRDWEEGRETIADRAKPIAHRRQWYQVSEYSEPRLCRYRDTMQWPPSVSFPYNAGYVAKERLPIRHYPHRDPDQLRVRSLLRAYLIAFGDKQLFTGYSNSDFERFRQLLTKDPRSKDVSNHWIDAEWRKFITLDQTADVKHWTPGTALDEVLQNNHLAPKHKRFAQRIIHALTLPLIDRTRTSWPADAYPSAIDPEVVERINRELL